MKGGAAISQGCNFGVALSSTTATFPQFDRLLRPTLLQSSAKLHGYFEFDGDPVTTQSSKLFSRLTIFVVLWLEEGSALCPYTTYFPEICVQVVKNLHVSL